MGLFSHVENLRGMGSKPPSWREMHDAHQAAAELETLHQKGRGKEKYRGSKEEAKHRARGKK